MKIIMKLKDIIKDDSLIEAAGVDPYAINEGADPETQYELEVDSVSIEV